MYSSVSDMTRVFQLERDLVNVMADFDLIVHTKASIDDHDTSQGHSQHFQGSQNYYLYIIRFVLNLLASLLSFHHCECMNGK